jgi:hypothetical protein
MLLSFLAHIMVRMKQGIWKENERMEFGVERRMVDMRDGGNLPDYDNSSKHAVESKSNKTCLTAAQDRKGLTLSSI